MTNNGRYQRKNTPKASKTGKRKMTIISSHERNFHRPSRNARPPQPRDGNTRERCSLGREPVRNKESEHLYSGAGWYRPDELLSYIIPGVRSGEGPSAADWDVHMVSSPGSAGVVSVADGQDQDCMKDFQNRVVRSSVGSWDQKSQFDADCYRVRDQQAGPATMARLASKAAILIAVPMCFHVMRRYGVSRGILPPSNTQPSQNTQWCYTKVSVGEMRQIGYLPTNSYKASHSFQPTWLACPDPLLFLAASMSAGILLARYHQLNNEDKFQNWALAMITTAGLAFGTCSGLTFLATSLSVTPWAALAGLILSDIMHSAWKALRSSCNMNVTDDLDNAQARDLLEKA